VYQWLRLDGRGLGREAAKSVAKALREATPRSADADAEWVELTLQEYERRDKGPTLSLRALVGDDFVSDAKELVRASCSVLAGMDVFLGVYLKRAVGRSEFEDFRFFWQHYASSTLTTCILFWFGARPESPAKLGERVAVLEQEVRSLKLSNSSSVVQEEVWRMHTSLLMEDLERKFPVGSFECDSARNVMDKRVFAKEADLQPAWGRVFEGMKLSVRDCTRPNGIQYGGRMHEIDFVLCARRDVAAIEYVDTPIELQEDICSDAKRRNVVLQLLARMGCVFDAQPKRTECWGVGLDGGHALFVCCKRDLSYAVTPSINLWESNCGGANRLFSFLRASSAARGYVDVLLPRLWGKEAVAVLTKHGEVAVFRLPNESAGKAGAEEAIRAEWWTAARVQAECPGLVSPLFLEGPTKTWNEQYPLGFRMSLHSAVSVKSEEELCDVLNDAFWCLGVLHTIGIAHNDVKPANMLRAEGGRHVLCDFGNALSWQEGDAMGTQRGATPLFAVMEGEFAASDSSMFACDMEGLFWSVLAMWLQVKEGSDTIPGLADEARRNALDNLSIRGKVARGDALLTPTAPLLVSYFGQAKTRVLWDARDVWRSHKALFEGDEAAWMRSVAEREKAESLPRCRPEILAWLLKRTN
jgi:hypothetical protein